MKRTVAVGMAAAALVVLTNGPATAGSSFTAAHKVAPTGCFGSQTSLDASGARHGFITCVTKSGSANLDYVSASPGAKRWTLRPMDHDGTLIAATDDGTASYALFISANRHTKVLIRSRSGKVRQTTVSSRETEYGAIAAYRGKWMAAEYLLGGIVDNTCPPVSVSGPLVHIKRPRQSNACGVPSLAVDRHGTPTLVTNPNLQVDAPISIRTWHHKNWSSGKKLGAGRDTFIVIAGKTTYVAYREYVTGTSIDYRTVLATRKGSHAWKHKAFAGVAVTDSDVPTRPQIAITDGAPAVAWTSVTKANREQVDVERKTGKHWSRKTLGDGTSGDAVMSELDATGGHLYVTIDHSDSSRYVVVRHS